MKINILLFGILMSACAVLAADAALPPLPSGTTSYWSYGIAAVTPILVWLIRKAVPTIPTPLLPTATPFIGLALGYALNKLADAHLDWVDMAKAGALAVFIRETVNQLVTKRLGNRPTKISLD